MNNAFLKLNVHLPIIFFPNDLFTFIISNPYIYDLLDINFVSMYYAGSSTYTIGYKTDDIFLIAIFLFVLKYLNIIFKKTL